MVKITFFCSFLLLMFKPACAQNKRINDPNHINWIQLFLTKKINAKTDILLEYQWRRTDFLKNGQQGLLRTLLQYKPNELFNVGIGYAEIETYPYGDFPIASIGRFPEHRIYEQFVFKQKINNTSITNRFRIEQRWLGKIKVGTNREIESWTYLHRFRYLLKIQKNIHKKFYGWVGNELFIGAGKNLGVNIFDQNRIHVNIGYKFKNMIAIEFGYLNQILQQGRLLNTNTIMQRNNGCTLSANINL